MRERLCSAWTVTLHYETSVTLAAALRRVDRPELAAGFEATAAAIRNDFQRLLIADETLAASRIGTTMGASTTGCIHAIRRPAFTTACCDDPRDHQRITHARAGAATHRLYPAPSVGPRRGALVRPAGGVSGRAAAVLSASREQHVLRARDRHHVHPRPPQVRGGDGALRRRRRLLSRAPPGHPDRNPRRGPLGQPRQANCYYSSSDATFADRYEALDRYAEINAGTIALEGGWRVYSSGAGIALRLIHECFLGCAAASRRWCSIR